MEPIHLTKAEARAIILHAAGLAKRAPFGKGREAVYKLIEHLGFVQIDTNYTVERAHHHVIATRVPDYKVEWLEELQADGRLFEFFTSDAGYMPMVNYRFSLPVKTAFSKRKVLTPPEVSLMNRVLDRIGREGPLMVKDFEQDRQEASMGWWDWRPSKVALERLYLNGQLMVTRNKDFHKVYDLPINLVPDDIETEEPGREEFARHVIRRELKALGIAFTKELAWRARYVKDHLIRQELVKMIEEGEICRVKVEGVRAADLFMLSSYKKKKVALSDELFILSPWDVVNVFRHRLREFFGFDYQIECFVPEAKRKYGYFSLPVLLGDQFIARMDSKADRKKRTLLIHNLHFESVKLNKQVLERLADAIKAYAQFNRCETVVITRSNHKSYQKVVTSAL